MRGGRATIKCNQVQWGKDNLPLNNQCRVTEWVGGTENQGKNGSYSVRNAVQMEWNERGLDLIEGMNGGP